MNLTKFTDNSLRVLIYVSLCGDRRVTISEIAERCSVPRNHLVKVVHMMAQKKFLDTTRGKGGGVRLARPAAAITVGEVVRAMEGNLQIIDCFEPRCPIVPSCLLKGILDEGKNAFLSALDKHTVAELVHDKARLKSLIAQPA